MRRSVRAAAVVLVSLGLVLAPALSASAVKPKPPAVDAIPTLPSTTTKALTGSPIGNDTIKVAVWMAAEVERLKAAKAAGLPAVARPPLTVPTTLTRGVTGNVLVDGFSVGFLLGSTGVRAYALVTGDNPLDSVCGSGLEFASSILYADLMPDCSPPPLEPNGDAGTGFGPMTYEGRTLTYNGKQGSAYCYTVSGSGAWSVAPNAFWVVNSSGQTVSYGSSFGSNPGLSQCSGFPSSTIWRTGVPIWIAPATDSTAVITSMAAVSSDPSRTASCAMTWPDGSTTTGSGPAYRESEGFSVNGVTTACNDAFVSKPGAGPGLLPSDIKVGSTNTESGAQTELANQEVPDFTESEKIGLNPGDNTGLLLLKVVSGVVQSCMTWEASCVGWWPATEQGTQPAVGTDLYRCTYGGTEVALTECGAYRYTFDTQTSTPTVTDPVTGEPFEWTSTSTGVNSLSPAASLDPSGDCWAEWSASPNPLEWVLQPVKCAIVWAFVPRANVTNEALVDLGNAAGDVAVVDPLMTLLAELPAGGGCDGIPFNLTFFGESVNGHLLGACSGEGAAAAAVVSGLLTLSMVTATVLAMLRYLAALFGFVGPGGSMEQTERATAVAVARSGKGSD